MPPKEKKSVSLNEKTVHLRGTWAIDANDPLSSLPPEVGTIRSSSGILQETDLGSSKNYESLSINQY